MSARAQPSLHPVLPALHHWQAHIAWVVGAATMGFLTSFVLSDLLELSRNWFVLFHATFVGAFAVAYVRWAEIDVIEGLRSHWLRGVIGGVIFAGLLAMAVQQMDAHPRTEGFTFVVDLFWLGVVYGTVDALLLNVLPVVAVWQASSSLGHTGTWKGKVVTGLLAFVASALVTAAYHVGYREFRGADIREPMSGTMITVGYLLSGNPITAFAGHIALHIASVIHGATVTLPPHY
ncbi:MAG TPA: hypothetical protein PKA95_04640 [Thermomicrobiales bacterium]|nr:hypothetical protein [Thermomicrobiales bacterium]